MRLHLKNYYRSVLLIGSYVNPFNHDSQWIQVLKNLRTLRALQHIQRGSMVFASGHSYLFSKVLDLM